MLTDTQTHRAKTSSQRGGRPLWTFPQVEGGHCWSAAADVYSLGACLFALLANSRGAWAGGAAPDFGHRTLHSVAAETKSLLRRPAAAAEG